MIKKECPYCEGRLECFNLYERYISKPHRLLKSISQTNNILAVCYDCEATIFKNTKINLKQLKEFDGNEIFLDTLKEHEGWWISDVALQLYQEGISIEETVLCMSKQGFLE